MGRRPRFHSFTPEWVLHSNLRLLCGNLLKRRRIDENIYVGVTLDGERTLLMGNPYEF